jgi:hypothetical protein
MAMRRVPCGRADLSRIAGTSRSHHWRWHNLKKNRVAFVPIGSITRGICGNSPDVLNLRRIKRDNSVGRDFERHVGEHDMPRAAQLFAPMSATTSASSRKSGGIPLDPILLFSGIGLLAFLIAVVTGVQGVWY